MRKIMILGGTGMLGHALFRRLYHYEDFSVYTTVRSIKGSEIFFSFSDRNRIIENVDASNFDSIKKSIENAKPDIVINCIAILRVNSSPDSIYNAININSLFPHKLHNICEKHNIRMIHISTDGVFDGKKGMYKEDDPIKISTIYGMTKYLGEICCRNCLTIRTSIIGHEIYNKKGLVEWFLSEKNAVKGYQKAIYSGFPTVELSRIIANYIISDNDIDGIYHVSSDPLSKYELLKIIRKIYKKKIEIVASERNFYDLSLDSSKFRLKSGYHPPPWEKMIYDMYCDHNNLN